MSRDVCNKCHKVMTAGSIPLDKDSEVWFCMASGVMEVVFRKFNPAHSCLKKFEHAVAESVNIDKIGADHAKP